MEGRASASCGRDSLTRSSLQDHYKILGIDRNASIVEIKRALCVSSARARALLLRAVRETEVPLTRMLGCAPTHPPSRSMSLKHHPDKGGDQATFVQAS